MINSFWAMILFLDSLQMCRQSPAFVRPENIFLQQISYLSSLVSCFCMFSKYIFSTDFTFLKFSVLLLYIQEIYFFNRFHISRIQFLYVQKIYFVKIFHMGKIQCPVLYVQKIYTTNRFHIC